MAVRPILIRRPPERVWSVLSDPDSYARWVVGTEDTELAAGAWPEVGSTLRYSVRTGPRGRAEGTTVVRGCEPRRLLELEARAPRLGSARISIRMLPWGDDTLVIVDEHPLTGAVGWLHNRAVDAALQLRHRQMLRRLARAVEEP
ncbi:SRPBCC family protein [Streptomyces sp. 4N509B]|uniref:SRPBCC family protein n=1 Tax=Streptomyces sp. 4N509B TaxID=3457413 RepID=UPI003FD58187